MQNVTIIKKYCSEYLLRLIENTKVFREAFRKTCLICDALRDLVPFAPFKKRENTHERVLILVQKLTLLHGCFSRFLNCKNGTKSRNASHICISKSHDLL